MRRTKTQIHINNNNNKDNNLSASNTEEDCSSSIKKRGSDSDTTTTTTIVTEHEEKMLSEKQTKKVVKKLFSINRYFFRSKLIPGAQQQNTTQPQPALSPLKLITAPPPPHNDGTTTLAGSNSSDVSSSDYDTNNNRVHHYHASIGSLKSDLAQARVMLDENRAAASGRSSSDITPGWAKILLDAGYYTGDNVILDNKHNKKNKKGGRTTTSSSTQHLLHLTVAYCGCLQCLAEHDVRSDDVPDSLGALDKDDVIVPNISDNKLDVLPNNNTNTNAAIVVVVDDDDIFHDESMGVFPHEIRRISTANSSSSTSLSVVNNNNNNNNSDHNVGCSMGSKCLIMQGRKECIFDKSGEYLTLHQMSPRSAVAVALPSEAALRALCDININTTNVINNHRTEKQLGTVRKGVATFCEQISRLNASCCYSVQPHDILRAAEKLYHANINTTTKKEKPSWSSSRKEPTPFVLQGTLYRFGLDAGIFPAINNTNTNSNNTKAVAVVFRRQPFVILSGTLCIRGKAMGEYVSSELQVVLGFGEDDAGARDVYPDGSLGSARNLCINELLVHVPMHLRDDRWELILR